MSETPFFPEPPPLGFPAPLRSKREEDASKQALPAMKLDDASTGASHEALGRSYARNREELLKFVYRCLKAAEDAEDLLHDVVLRALKQDLTGRCGPNEECIKAYLMRAIKNRVFDKFREQRQERRKHTGFAAYVVTMVRAAADRTSRRAEIHDIERQVDRLIRKLPPRCQEAFIARRISEMTPREAAEKMGVSVKTVKVHFTKALCFFRTELAALGYYIPDLERDEKEDTP